MLMRRSKVYYLRLWVPQDLRSTFNRKELKKSLKTTDRREAKAVASSLIHKAETTFIRIRAGMLTDRELEQIAAELIEEFTGKIATHKAQRADGTDWLFSEGGFFPSVDIDMIETTLKTPKTPEEVAAVGAWYSSRILDLEQEIATEFYSRKTRNTAKKIVTSKYLNVELPPAGWFDDPGFIPPPRYDAEFDEYPQQLELADDDQKMEMNKVWSSPAPPAFNAVCITLLQAQLDAFCHELEKVQGKRGTPLQMQTTTRIEASKPRPKLSDLWKEHLAEKETREQWAPRTKGKNEAAIRRVIERLGDRELGAYQEADAIELIKHFKGKSRSVSHVNFNLELLSTLWIRALKRPKLWQVEYNPWSDKQLIETRAPSEERDAFTKEDLARIFRGLSTIRRHVNPERFWVPLISLYSGMRLNEPCQLLTSDVVDVDGVVTFHINHRPELHQATKSKKDRTCPVHPVLKKLGFLRYVEEQRNRKKDRLFSNLTLTDVGWNRKVEGWFNRGFKKKHLGEDSTKTFHSIRHTFIDEFKQGSLIKTRDDEHVLKSIVGHTDGVDADGGITFNQYGKAYPLARQLKLLSRLNYGVDLNLLENNIHSKS